MTSFYVHATDVRGGHGNCNASGVPVAFNVCCLIAWASLAASACGQNPDGLPETFSAVAEKYGVKVVLSSPEFPQKTHWGLIEGVAAAEIDLKRYERLF